MIALQYECVMSILGGFVAMIAAVGALTCPVQAAEANPPYPDVEEMCSKPFDEDFLDGVIACGWDAFRYRMKDNIYRSNIGELRTHDATLKTTSDETLWLLSCAPSQTYIAYQPHPHRQLPLELDSPIARIESKRFPFGKLVATKTRDTQLKIEIDAGFRPFWSSVHWRAEVWKKLSTHPGNILIYTDAEQVTATINGDEMPVNSKIRNRRKVWVIDPYARIPRIRDRVGKRRA